MVALRQQASGESPPSASLSGDGRHLDTVGPGSGVVRAWSYKHTCIDSHAGGQRAEEHMRCQLPGLEVATGFRVSLRRVVERGHRHRPYLSPIHAHRHTDPRLRLRLQSDGETVRRGDVRTRYTARFGPADTILVAVLDGP